MENPTPKEVKLERALELKNKEIQKLKAQRDTTDEYASNMQQRSNKAMSQTGMNLIML